MLLIVMPLTDNSRGSIIYDQKIFIMQAIELLDQRDDTFKKRVYILSIFLSLDAIKVVSINWLNSATQFGHL